LNLIRIFNGKLNKNLNFILKKRDLNWPLAKTLYEFCAQKVTTGNNLEMQTTKILLE